MRPITQQIQAIQALEAAGASRELAEAIAVTVEASALAARDAAWERVEAKMESLRTDLIAHVDALRTEMDSRFDKLRTEMNGGFDKLRTEMNSRFENVNSRFDKMDVRFATVDQNIATVEANLERSLRVTSVSLVVFVMALTGVILAVLRFFPAPH